jgi:hypothetical protein
MPAFSIAITQNNVSMRNLDSGKTLDLDLDDIPSRIYGQLKNEVRTSGLKKPMCSSRIINLSSESDLYLWFLYEKNRTAACSCDTGVERLSS